MLDLGPEWMTASKQALATIEELQQIIRTYEETDKLKDQIIELMQAKILDLEKKPNGSVSIMGM